MKTKEKKMKKKKKIENLISQIIHFQTIQHELIVCPRSMRVSSANGAAIISNNGRIIISLYTILWRW